MAEQTLLNPGRPPVFCPGCSHDTVLKALDRTFVDMGLPAESICMVSDIGCSGLFDTFFNTHAMHGVHGRALTYASGIKLSRPELNVVVTLGDGGLGIGGAHLLAACRRNLDLTLLVLNNFNFGMTGGQYSATTPNEAVVGSGFLNRLEKPLDLPAVAAAAGAPLIFACSAYQKDLPEIMAQAIKFPGFAVVEIQGLCPGRYTRKNKLTPSAIKESLAARAWPNGPVAHNQRPEYGKAYREQAASLPPASRPAGIEPSLTPPEDKVRRVALLGSAGQRAVTAGELLGLAGICAGLHVSQKNEYNITVLRGPSIAELILSPAPIDYTGIEQPDVALAIAPEGVERRRQQLAGLTKDALIIRAAGVEIPETRAEVLTVDFKAQGIKSVDWALASCAVLAKLGRALSLPMLEAALAIRFRGKVLESAKQVVDKAHPSA